VSSELVNGTVEDVLSTCLDLATPLPQRSLGILALFVRGDDDTSKEQRQKLKELSTVAGGALYRDYVRSERRGLADVLVDFDRCAPSIEALVDACPRLRPRHYSIASCSTDTIELCVARALLETPLGRKVYGLCSSWLCDLREGSLLIGVRRGEFSPINEDPLVFVGPGTGVAPARAFALSQPSDMLLFFGCRHESKDRLYADEFAGLAQLEVDVSVSRHTDASQRRYVTKALRARATDVASWILDRSARFYIAGNAKMAADVALALCDCLAPRCGGEQKAAALLRRLEREGRFATEAFG
jgi:sulfite reductase (NADPH) flavoprotein alpha-component